MQLGTIMPMEDDPMAGQLPDIVGEWEAIFRRETITGPVAGSTPIVTSQSPPPPPVPAYYPPPIGIVPDYGIAPLTPWLIGGAVLLLVVVLVRT